MDTELVRQVLSGMTVTSSAKDIVMVTAILPSFNLAAIGDSITSALLNLQQLIENKNPELNFRISHVDPETSDMTGFQGEVGNISALKNFLQNNVEKPLIKMKAWRGDCTVCSGPVMVPRNKDMDLETERAFCIRCGLTYRVDIEGQTLKAWVLRQWQEKSELD